MASDAIGARKPGMSLAEAATWMRKNLPLLAEDARKSRARLRNKYDLGDIRVGTTGMMRNTLNALSLAAFHLEEDLLRPAWWNEHGLQASPEAIEVEASSYERMLYSVALLLPLSYFENGLRRVGRAIDAEAHRGGTDAFRTIYGAFYEGLRADGWSWSAGDPVQFLDVMRTLRNTIHNNGSYWDPRRAEDTLVWRGIEYRFRRGEPLEIDVWPMLSAHIRDLLDLTEQTMTSPRVVRLAAVR